MYPWPRGEFDNVMDDALDIAMDYLVHTDKAVKFRHAQTIAANAISEAWRAGIKSRVRLTNLAIRAVEQSKLTTMTQVLGHGTTSATDQGQEPPAPCDAAGQGGVLVTADRGLLIEALETAQIILAEHIQPGGPGAEATINRLLAVLDTKELAEAMLRLKAGYGLRVVR